LRETDLPLSKIALKSGFNDEFYFSRKFTKEVGVPPSVYRKGTVHRIAVASPADVGNLLALGIIPVAAPIDPKWTPYYYITCKDRIDVHLPMDVPPDEYADPGRLLAAKAHVLVSRCPLSDPAKKRIQPFGIRLIDIQSTDWRSQLRELAAALGEQARCENWIREYESKAALARDQIGRQAREDRFAVLRLRGGQFYLYCNAGIRDLFLQDLRLNLIGGRRQPCNTPIDLEQLNDLNPDRLLLLICPDAETRAHWLALRHQSQWRKLKAVRTGQCDLIPSDPWFEYSAAALSRMLDEMLLMLTGKSPSLAPVPVHGGRHPADL
jgi:ABC-type Fe3+-hydroxamate transport system substrate-binding protein